MVAMGSAYKRFGNELEKGINADPTELARAQAMIRQTQMAQKGFGNQGQNAQQDQNLKGGPGGRRDVDLGIDPHTQNPVNSVPSGQGNQPFIT
jgi:hypothetical protein